MYAAYHDCDPLRSKEIAARDELLPLYVMTYMGHLQGVPGLFVAGIFSASLGTVATALNSLTAVTVKDFLNGALKWELPDEQGAKIGKWISFGFGLLSFGLVFVVEQMGSVLQIALSFNGMVGGITLGLFSLGMFFPWSNSKGALCGAAVATGVVLWIGLGTQIALASGIISFEEKFTSVAGCVCTNTSEVLNTVLPDLEKHEPQWWIQLYKLSYLWYSLLGFLLTIVVGLVVSILTGSLDTCCLDEDLMSPPVRRWLLSLSSNTKRMLRLSEETKENAALGKTEVKEESYKSVDLNGIQNLSFIPEDDSQTAVNKSGSVKSDLRL